MKKDRSVLIVVLALLLIIGASYFDQKDAENIANDDEITRLQVEEMQPTDHVE